MSTHAASYTIFFFRNTISAFGTSAVAPLWAGLAALMNQTLGNRVGFLNPVLYRNTAAFRDIITGNNGAYAAGAAWDACTGLGSPNGASLVAVMKPARRPQDEAIVTSSKEIGAGGVTSSYWCRMET
jgi:kumamolisin